MDQTRRELSTLQHSFGEQSSSAGRGQVSKGTSHPYESSNNIPFDSDGINSRANGKQIASGSSPSGSVVFPRDLGIGHHEDDVDDDDGDDDSQLIEQLEMYTTACDSFCGSFDVPGSSFDGPRVSCKRKAVETTHIGSSSGTLSSEQTERVSQWGSTSAHQNDAQNNIITPAQIATDAGNNNEPGQANNPIPRHGVVDESLSTGSLRNVRLRIDDSPQQDHELIHATENRNIQESSSAPPLHVPYVRRNAQSRWGASSSSSASEESNTTAREDLITRDQNQSRATDHSVSIPAVETGSSSQEPSNGNSNSENNGSNSNHANAGSSYRTVSNRNARPYSAAVDTEPEGQRERLEMARRVLLSAVGAEAAEGQRERLEMARRLLLSAVSAEAEGHRDRSDHVMLPGSSSSSSSSSLQEPSPSSGSISLDQRNIDNALELPHSLRSLFGSAEGRSGLMSEQIRQFFDLMRSGGGEGVRFEDLMLDHSFLFNMADLNDRHRDMRMDVDDMSYEELLELGEQIGNVCTGLKEGIISSHLKQHKFEETQPKIETEPCSICREEYVEGEDIGKLDCGHDFHTDCVKQWLMLKNLCPVCKTTGLNHQK